MLRAGNVAVFGCASKTALPLVLGHMGTDWVSDTACCLPHRDTDRCKKEKTGLKEVVEREFNNVVDPYTEAVRIFYKNMFAHFITNAVH